MGSDVTIIGRSPYLVKNEDHEVSELLRQELSNRMKFLTNNEGVAIPNGQALESVKPGLRIVYFVFPCVCGRNCDLDISHLEVFVDEYD